MLNVRLPSSCRVRQRLFEEGDRAGYIRILLLCPPQFISQLDIAAGLLGMLIDDGLKHCLTFLTTSSPA